MGTRKPRVVLDSTVLSNFLQIDQVALLRRLPFVLCTVPQVIAEIQQGMQEKKVPEASLEWLEVLELSDVEQQLFLKYHAFLGAGEAAALAVCQSRGPRLATDDLSARRLSAQLQIPLTGTVGLLMLAVKMELTTLQEADIWLQEMIGKGYHSPIRNLTELNRV
jgi:predicted nucleic acid-binding protein